VDALPRQTSILPGGNDLARRVLRNAPHGCNAKIKKVVTAQSFGVSSSGMKTNSFRLLVYSVALSLVAMVGASADDNSSAPTSPTDNPGQYQKHPHHHHHKCHKDTSTAPSTTS
jgi:hypothetical protein